jgi:uncharacterized membrane protein YcaP (DUF421 family)
MDDLEKVKELVLFSLFFRILSFLGRISVTQIGQFNLVEILLFGSNTYMQLVLRRYTNYYSGLNLHPFLCI